MKKLLIAIAAGMGLALGQGALFGELLSASVGFTPSFSLIGAVQAGATQVVGPLGARLGLSVLSGGGVSRLGVNADVLYPVELQPGRLEVGLGLGVSVASAGGTSTTDVALRGILGYELPLQGALALRLEPIVGYSFNAQQVKFSINLGPRIYLR